MSSAVRTKGGDERVWVEYDGTASDLLRVIRAARKGE